MAIDTLKPFSLSFGCGAQLAWEEMLQKENLQKDALSKPYPNYHAARLRTPGSFTRIRVLSTSSEGIMLYGGPLKSDPRGGAKVQSIRFPKKKFSVAEAKKWLKDHKHKTILFEPASEKAEKNTDPKWPTITEQSEIKDNG